MPADPVAVVHEAWSALGRGDLGALEAVFAPDARWRAVEDGPWNCEGRAAILEVLTRNLAGGVSGAIDDAFQIGDAVVVAFRPDPGREPPWPLEDGLRHVVVTLREGKVVEMKGCATRGAAVAYAQASAA
jgi:ketosteroid isomerase-like protein